MIRTLSVSVVVVAMTGHALAQVAAPPANAPGGGRGAGRGAFPPVVIGPPAPVPPEVAIPRPTPEELAKVNDAIAHWVSSDTSSVKPLLEKFQNLMLLQPPRMNVTATYTQTTQRMGPRHQ